MRQIRAISNALAILAGWAVLLLALIVTAEVLSRKLFSYSFQAADELGGYILAIASVTGFSCALVARAHTRIDLVLDRLPAPLKAALNILAYLTLTGFAAYMAWHAWIALSQSISLQSRSFTPLRTPLWIPQAMWFASLAFFAFSCLWATMTALSAIRRDLAAANEDFGPRSIEGAEIEEIDAAVETHIAQEKLS
ncbi:MAG: TRAP transporter small permease [Oricola sp.]